MELHRETFTVNGEYLGDRLFKPVPSPYPVLSMVIYCPYCGEVWARRTIIPAVGYTAEFFAHRFICERCGDGRLLTVGGGSADLRGAYLTDYPMPVLQRELAIYAKLFSDPKTDYWVGGIPRVTNPFMKLQEKQS